jgi:hypothetical protein
VALLLALLGAALWITMSYASTFPLGSKGARYQAYTTALVASLAFTFVGHNMLMTFFRHKRNRHSD